MCVFVTTDFSVFRIAGFLCTAGRRWGSCGEGEKSSVGCKGNISIGGLI